MYNNVEFSDTIVKAKDAIFQVHAVVLAAHSASFGGMLKVGCTAAAIAFFYTAY